MSARTQREKDRELIAEAYKMCGRFSSQSYRLLGLDDYIAQEFENYNLMPGRDVRRRVFEAVAREANRIAREQRAKGRK